MMILSPLAIEMLLNCYYNVSKYDTRGGKAQRDIIFNLINEDMIQIVCAGSGCEMNGLWYRTTGRGKAMVDKLCAVPLPVPVTKWE